MELEKIEEEKLHKLHARTRRMLDELGYLFSVVDGVPEDATDEEVLAHLLEGRFPASDSLGLPNRWMKPERLATWDELKETFNKWINHDGEFDYETFIKEGAREGYRQVVIKSTLITPTRPEHDFNDQNVQREIGEQIRQLYLNQLVEDVKGYEGPGREPSSIRRMALTIQAFEHWANNNYSLYDGTAQILGIPRSIFLVNYIDADHNDAVDAYLLDSDKWTLQRKEKNEEALEASN